MVQKHPSEKIIDVQLLNLDSTSMRQIRDTHPEDLIPQRIMEIVATRGKMHNPVTKSGGVLLGTYGGKKVVPWPSLSAIPLFIERVLSVHGDQVEVIGKAVLFQSYNMTEVADEMKPKDVLAALDVSSLTDQVQRQLSSKTRKVLILGCGKAGFLAAATVRMFSANAEIFAIDKLSTNFGRIKNELKLVDHVKEIDATNAAEVVQFISDRGIHSAGHTTRWYCVLLFNGHAVRSGGADATVLLLPFLGGLFIALLQDSLHNRGG